jgi:putative ABC transport system substrate-binding protein
MSDMMRRAFIALLGAATIWPLAVRAEKNDGVRRVGVIMGFAEDDKVWQTYLATFRQALRDLGWADGRNIRFRLPFHRRQRAAYARHGRGNSAARA